MRLGWLLALMLVTSPLAGCIGETLTTDEDLEASSTGEAGGFSDEHVFEGEYETGERFSTTLEEGPYDVLGETELYLESELDGADIEVGLVRPDVPNGTEVPVIAFASPYLSPLHGRDMTEVRPRLTDNFVEHGYAVAFIAVRGTANSGGCSDLMGPMERADLDQAVTWLGEQPWSNGNVGMLGVSYDGSTPWEVAAQGNPHLKTIVPISGVNDEYQLMYHNGSAETRGMLVLNALYYAYGFAFDSPIEGRSVPKTADGIVCPEAYEGFAASMHSSVVGERSPLGYWAERNSRPGVEENYDGSIFLVHGLQDWNVDPHHAMPWVHDELDHERNLTVKYWLGQWYHAWPDGDYLDQPIRRVDFVETLLHWFDRWLKEDTSRDLGPRVQVQDSTLQWRSADHWPPGNATERVLHPIADGSLTGDADTSTGTVPVTTDSSLAVEDPMTFENRQLGELACSGCAVFTTGPVDDELRFAGLPTFHARVTPSGPTGHLAAFLYALEDGTYTRLGWSQMDLRFHDGDDQADTLTPGEPVVARMQFQPLDALVPADAELVLVVSQGQKADRQEFAPPSPVQLHVGGDLSQLTLETFSVPDDRTFAPPGSE